MNNERFNHLGEDGSARMVDVSEKSVTLRFARAEAVVRIGADVARRLLDTGSLAKGNVIETARIAGITAAKKTADLIPLCHPIQLDRVDIRAMLEDDVVRIECEALCNGRTGVEMEAMTGAAVAALTVYDMCKSVDRGITITDLELLEKEGGKSGRWRRK